MSSEDVKRNVKYLIKLQFEALLLKCVFKGFILAHKFSQFFLIIKGKLGNSFSSLGVDSLFF